VAPARMATVLALAVALARWTASPER
jgi:hypothetical protein